MKPADFAFLAVSALLLSALASCDGGGKGEKGDGGPGKAKVIKDVSELPAHPRNVAIMESITEIGRAQFPDHPENTWLIHSVLHEGALSHVEAEPVPDDVGYPAFIFTLHYSGGDSASPDCIAVYAQSEGKFVLLWSAAEYEGEIPRER